MSKKRIVISGASGTGKTTLAYWTAKHYNIPFISTSAKNLWAKHGIKTHQELITKGEQDFQWGIDFQFELLEYRLQVTSKLDEWVSDRGPLDNIVYFLNQNSQNADKDTTLTYLTRALDFMRIKQTHQIMLAFSKEIPLETKGNDGMRITNPYYQYMIDAIYQRVMETYIPQVKVRTMVVPFWDFEQRKTETLKFLSDLIMPGQNGKAFK
jgi:hypothetical protein